MSKRRLRPDEEKLWSKVASQTTPLDRKSVAPLPSPKPDTNGTEPAFDLHPPKQDTAPKSTLHYDLAPSVSASLAAHPIQMDRKSFTQLKRGKLKPEARIDLHGMTVDRAHQALTRFVFDAHAKQKRLILVITGKGKLRDEGGPIPARLGVLRHQVPQWLALAPLANMVLQVSPAHIKHGGDGAYYVYLRKRQSR